MTQALSPPSRLEKFSETSKCRLLSLWLQRILLFSLCLTLLVPPVVAEDHKLLLATIPDDIEGSLQQKDPLQRARAAALFSWRSFAALQEPAGTEERETVRTEAGRPETGPRVWETWKEPYEVYLKDGSRPPAWGVPMPIPEQNAPPGQKMLFRNTKVTDVLDEKVQATQADGRFPPTLTDQKGQLVRYEIRMNRTVFEHILQEKLYDGRVQSKVEQVSYPEGACLIKASWKELKAEERGRYITSDCWIVDGDSGQSRLMGLVGFHMMIKTPSAPQWIWATFEQVDNLRGDHPSFFSPNSSQEANTQTPVGLPTQVTRTIPIPDWLQALNQNIQSQFAQRESVLQYYELIETQRPILQERPPGTPATVFTVEPEWLSNSTQETFIQASSCMGCHAMAQTLNSAEFVSGDFTFTLNNAWPKPPGSDVIAPPQNPHSKWEGENWSQIQRGLALAENTYELLPKHVGNRLHCASCHLDGGRNKNASWWVGMREAYDYPATDRLEQRIDKCFTHSMNGTALSSKENEPNRDMEALLSYMEWIDRQFDSGKKSQAARGFPPIEKGTGVPERGHAIYKQKCTYCHNTDGQGRYQGDVYFRPALWGKDSFPKRAGMADTETLASFIKANMPLGSGGMLSTQEAWDLASFIESRQRP